MFLLKKTEKLNVLEKRCPKDHLKLLHAELAGSKELESNGLINSGFIDE
jgi:hypothetical protein